MNSELFIELSEEQQEIVAGGGQLIELELDKYAKYHASVTTTTNSVISGPGGSTVAFNLANASIKTEAGDYVYAMFD